MQITDVTQKALECLLKSGIKPSLQRVAVMEYLLTHKTHPTADEIFNELSLRMPTLSKTTVYNTLNRLSETGTILSLDIDQKKTRFDGDTSFHAHFLCKGCGVVSDLEIRNRDFAGEILPEGMHASDVQLLYKGYCEKCNKKENN